MAESGERSCCKVAVLQGKSGTDLGGRIGSVTSFLAPSSSSGLQPLSEPGSNL